MSTDVIANPVRRDLWHGPVIDCDAHANLPSIDALFPYMDEVWVEWITERGWGGPLGVGLAYPPNCPSTLRSEWEPKGQVPASELSLLQQHILDAWDVERAVVSCYSGVDGVRHPDLAVTVARAVNDWLIDKWLEQDSRLVASIVVPARDPAAAVAEIDRVGSHPGFVQVLLPVRSDRPYGHRAWHPVFHAAVQRDLVVGLHWGGTVEAAPSPTGYASWYVEEYAAEWQAFASQVTSMISEGVFKSYPDLRVSVLEGGFTWMPPWAWRMNKEWKGLRTEIPWVDRPPLALIREHMRFSTAPTDAGPPELMVRAVAWLGSANLLMYATDYPHRHDDDLADLLAAVPSEHHAQLMASSAREWYRLPEPHRGTAAT
jgi:predicted TIM-barrel fold metal-dependent hydrolase